MLYLIPAPLHRLALRIGYALRRNLRGVVHREREGVAVIVRDSDGRVLLARHSYGPAAWALLGGGMGRGEDPAAAARREMREELGCELEALECLEIIEETLSGAPHKAHVFTARLKGEAVADGREIAELRWFSPAELHDALVTKVTYLRLTALGFYNSDS